MVVVASCPRPEQKLLSHTFNLAKEAYVFGHKRHNFTNQNKMAVSSVISPQLLLVTMLIVTLFLTPTLACKKQVKKFNKGNLFLNLYHLTAFKKIPKHKTICRFHFNHSCGWI